MKFFTNVSLQHIGSRERARRTAFTIRFRILNCDTCESFSQKFLRKRSRRRNLGSGTTPKGSTFVLDDVWKLMSQSFIGLPQMAGTARASIGSVVGAELRPGQSRSKPMSSPWWQSGGCAGQSYTLATTRTLLMLKCPSAKQLRVMPLRYNILKSHQCPHFCSNSEFDFSFNYINSSPLKQPPKENAFTMNSTNIPRVKFAMGWWVFSETAPVLPGHPRTAHVVLGRED